MHISSVIRGTISEPAFLAWFAVLGIPVTIVIGLMTSMGPFIANMLFGLIMAILLGQKVLVFSVREIFRRGFGDGLKNIAVLSTVIAASLAIFGYLPFITEIVSEKQAVIVKPNNVRSLREGIETLLNSADKRMSLARSAKKLSEQHSWQKVAARLEGIYSSI